MSNDESGMSRKSHHGHTEARRTAGRFTAKGEKDAKELSKGNLRFRFDFSEHFVGDQRTITVVHLSFANFASFAVNSPA
jgi:hypothetical protein